MSRRSTGGLKNGLSVQGEMQSAGKHIWALVPRARAFIAFAVLGSMCVCVCERERERER